MADGSGQIPSENDRGKFFPGMSHKVHTAAESDGSG
jgi:hypothetical protein